MRATNTPTNHGLRCESLATATSPFRIDAACSTRLLYLFLTTAAISVRPEAKVLAVIGVNRN